MILRLQSTASTMKDAAALALRGELHGTVVVAETQTAGVGRHGHSWYSGSDGGLYLSIILRVPLAAEAMPVLTMALGLAAQRAVNDVAAVACDLRWPNDLLLNEKKLAGIMVQVAGAAFIAGIGINVNQPEFPADIRAIATSLRIETGREHSKDALLESVVAESLHYATLLASRGKAEVLRQFEAQSSYARGKSVEVEEPDRVITGVTAGLDPNGFLRVQTPQGIETVIAGGVRPRT